MPAGAQVPIGSIPALLGVDAGARLTPSPSSSGEDAGGSDAGADAAVRE
jgi:hypothetical protein